MAPGRGEASETVAVMGRVVVEVILSGQLAGPAEYLQDQDEWVVVLDGSARLEVGGRTVRLGPGDWLLLPSRTPHRLLHAEPGTRWLAVHVHPEVPQGTVSG